MGELMLGDVDDAVAATGSCPDVEFDIRTYLSGIGAQLAGPANVIMQLSHPAVGYAVIESPVESGNILRHPVKRARTTFTYLAVALLGTDDDRRAYRRAVTRQHVQVRSSESSPLPYSALDPELQLWVAACLYYGTADLIERMHGPLETRIADQLYSYCARFGTSLQVGPHMWPPSRVEFDRYWTASLARARIEPPVSDYLSSLVHLDNLPAFLRVPLAGVSLFWTRGFLPPPLREQMGMEWSEAEERTFVFLLRLLGAADRIVPTAVRILPFELLLRDMRRRRRSGRPLV